MNCERSLQLLSAHLDREIQKADLSDLKKHLHECPDCREASLDLRVQDAKLRHLFEGCGESGPRVERAAIHELQKSPVVTVNTPYRSSRFLAVLAMAAALAGIAVVGHQWWNRSQQPVDQNLIAQVVPEDYLTPRPKPAAVEEKPAEVGSTIATEANQRRRIVLPDQSVVYLNQNTSLKIDGERRISLQRGEIFVEVAPQAQTDSPKFVVNAPRREMTALGTKFAVNANDEGSGLVVTQGKVKVSDLNDLVLAGQQVELGKCIAVTAPRASYLLDWARELMIAADSPLVPASKYRGGALIAADSAGEQAKLNMRKFHVDVVIEDGFARTTIDQTYFNHSPSRLEGTFYFPLPPDASLSRLAMYVDGNLMEGGMAESDYARDVYEQIVHSQRDPALLEWLDGSTFKMRVFPLEPFQEKRIILSYTQRLGSLYGETAYRFPSGHSMGKVERWSFEARVRGVGDIGWTSDSHEMQARVDNNDLILSTQQKNARLDKDVTLRLLDPAMAAAGGAARFTTHTHEGNRYLMMRYRPTLTQGTAKSGERQPRNWVFLFESSGDRDPVLARTQCEIIRTFLQNLEHQDRFIVLSAGTRVIASHETPVPANAVNIKNALSFLDRRHLVGALDLGRALQEATSHLAGNDSYLVHVGSGIAALGERSESDLIDMLPPNARYVGVGVGNRWSRSFMKNAAERSRGAFTQINPDEPIGWRAFELNAMLNTPRLLKVSVADNDTNSAFHLDTTAIAQGEELCAVARLQDKELPKNLVVRGSVDGQAFEQIIPVDQVRDNAGYLPRTWAKLEIDRLLADSGQDHKKQIIALSKDMYVMTRYTSLLVLENEEMYEQFKVDKGRKDHWAMYDCPAKIPVVYDPPAWYQHDRFAPKADRPHANEVRGRIYTRPTCQVLAWPNLTSTITGHGYGEGKGGLTAPTSPPMRSWSKDVRNSSELLRDGFPAERLAFENRQRKSPNKFREDSANMPNSFRMRIESIYNSNERGRENYEEQDEDFSVNRIAYGRPYFSYNRELFFNLPSFAPGLNSTPSDIEAVVENEARPSLNMLPGKIDDAARKLLDSARSISWKSHTHGNFQILVDGQGRHAWQRTLPSGLREQVVCDGQTVWHLYPELGLASKRTFSRFHRGDLAKLVPWFVPAAEDLARGADLELVDNHTIAIVPHVKEGDEDATQTQVHLVFAKDGRLAERKVIEKKGEQARVVSRDVHERLGIVKSYDAQGKEIETSVSKVEDAEQPALTPDLDALVVLDMPWRTPWATISALSHNRWFGDHLLNNDEALRLMCAELFNGNPNRARVVFDRCIHQRGLAKRGHYTLLACTGASLSQVPGFHADLVNNPNDPLLRHLALSNNPTYARVQRFLPVHGASAQPDGFFRRLGELRDITRIWQAGRGQPWNSDRQIAIAVDYIERNRENVYGYAVLDVLSKRPQTRKLARRLTDCWALFQDVPELAYCSRYEYARFLHKSGQEDAAREAFFKLYRETLANGNIPSMDHAIIASLGNAWSDLLLEAAQTLIAKKQWARVISLAEQVHGLGDQPLSEALTALALQVPESSDDFRRTQVEAVQFFRRTGRLERADQTIRALVARPEFAKDADLWRLASEVSDSRGMANKRIEALEQALELEFNNLPKVINLEDIREDYRKLLDHYLWLAQAARAVNADMPNDLATKTIRAADRWRALDPHETRNCQLAAEVFKVIGDRDIAWEYLTTPLAMKPTESEAWRSLAQSLSREGRHDLADLAMDAAYQAEPTNAQLLWDRANMLKATGKQADALKLYQQIAKGTWQPRFAWIQGEAKKEMLGR